MDRWKIIKAQKNTSSKNRLKMKDRYPLIPRIFNIRKLEYCMLYRSVYRVVTFSRRDASAGVYFYFSGVFIGPFDIEKLSSRDRLFIPYNVDTWYTLVPYYFYILNWMDQWGKSSLSIFCSIKQGSGVFASVYLNVFCV